MISLASSSLMVATCSKLCNLVLFLVIFVEILLGIFLRGTYIIFSYFYSCVLIFVSLQYTDLFLHRSGMFLTLQNYSDSFTLPLTLNCFF